MRNWIIKMAEKYRIFMYGRYGYDEFSRFLLIFALVLVLVANFFPVLSYLGLAVIIYSVYRTYSKNIPARMREREKFLRIKKKISQFFKRTKNRFKERKTHKYFKCRKCNTYLRVPKGRGKIEITCPMCKTKVTKTT